MAGPRPAFLSPFATPALEEADADASAKKDKRKKRLRLRIDGDWYDCTGWAKAHPGGSLFITLMDGCDATDVFTRCTRTAPTETTPPPAASRCSPSAPVPKRTTMNSWARAR